MDKTSIVEKTLINNYHKYYKLAFSYVGNDFDTMDIVQEGAYKAILKSSSLKNIQYVDTWIYRIIINEAKNFLSKNKVPNESFDDVNININDKYQDLDLKNALNILEEPDKTIIILKFFEELKTSQIAQVLDINLNTVKSRLYRGIKKLETLMEGS